MKNFHYVVYNKTQDKYLRECIEFVGIPGESVGLRLFKYSWTSIRMSRKYDTRGFNEGDRDFTYLNTTLRRVREIYSNDEIVVLN